MKLGELAIYVGAGGVGAYLIWRFLESSMIDPAGEFFEDTAQQWQAPDGLNAAAIDWLKAHGRTGQGIALAAVMTRRVFPSRSLITLVAAGCNAALGTRIRDIWGTQAAMLAWVGVIPAGQEVHAGLVGEWLANKRLSESQFLTPAYGWLVDQTEAAAAWAVAREG